MPFATPDKFWANVLPRYIPFNVWHNRREVVAKYVTIHLTNDPYALCYISPRLTMILLRYDEVNGYMEPLTDPYCTLTYLC